MKERDEVLAAKELDEKIDEIQSFLTDRFDQVWAGGRYEECSDLEPLSVRYGLLSVEELAADKDNLRVWNRYKSEEDLAEELLDLDADVIWADIFGEEYGCGEEARAMIVFQFVRGMLSWEDLLVEMEVPNELPVMLEEFEQMNKAYKEMIRKAPKDEQSAWSLAKKNDYKKAQQLKKEYPEWFE